MWIKSYIGIGSNLGDRRKNIQSALEVLKEKKDIIVEKVSPFYETLPAGGPSQDKFLNGVIEISTILTPQELLKVLQGIEKSLGRVRKERWGPRTIDLDMLIYGDLIVHEEGLIVPHPLMHKREFVLKPLLHISPDLIHPVLKKPIKVLLDNVLLDQL